MFLPCTSARALTSAITVSVWPFQDARCSAVFLRSHEAIPQDRPTAWTVPSESRLLANPPHARLAREAAQGRTHRWTCSARPRPPRPVQLPSRCGRSTTQSAALCDCKPNETRPQIHATEWTAPHCEKPTLRTWYAALNACEEHTQSRSCSARLHPSLRATSQSPCGRCKTHHAVPCSCATIRLSTPFALHCEKSKEIQGQPHLARDVCTRRYPSLSLQCTSAPASISAIAVSVWPLDDAECSAVRLHTQ